MSGISNGLMVASPESCRVRPSSTIRSASRVSGRTCSRIGGSLPRGFSRTGLGISIILCLSQGFRLHGLDPFRQALALEPFNLLTQAGIFSLQCLNLRNGSTIEFFLARVLGD